MFQHMPEAAIAQTARSRRELVVKNPTNHASQAGVGDPNGMSPVPDPKRPSASLTR